MRPIAPILALLLAVTPAWAQTDVDDAMDSEAAAVSTDEDEDGDVNIVCDEDDEEEECDEPDND